MDIIGIESAINSTVYKEEAEQVLAIQVNGNQSVTVEELVEAGYAVSFLIGGNFSYKYIFVTTGKVTIVDARISC